MTTLLLTSRHSADTQALWRAAIQRGWDVERMPDAVVLDVGHFAGRGWAAVELNEATSSGLYGCDADRVLDVLPRATRPRPV